ncbi:SHC SH2 domain-binding protein 1 isoform X2 [Callorhinchus milii]|uniref:SHC SH2 domain-binding protein 1 isoform X2 n=1 Tax=Callorhinchus milii TaxID=7868 RepID=UPI0004572A48|nr:SHC SH2 domain-binding protein 1 isoform X2 [Callorhinchus milii]|eukprot:gi/632944605/ref/XP_007887597.1/ PREDICTED: SHC SH2 domain-binding protein 1 isoform X2 [Callorhinchus milii]
MAEEEEAVCPGSEMPTADEDRQESGEQLTAGRDGPVSGVENSEHGSKNEPISHQLTDCFKDEEEIGKDHDYPIKEMTSKKHVRTVEFPEVIETTQLSYYERYKAYQDYILGDTKPSEVKDFIAEYLDKVLEPYGWQAIWSNDVFEVLVEITDVVTSSLQAKVHLTELFLYESETYPLSREAMESFLEAKEHLVPLQDLYVAVDGSGEFDQTALAIEHIRFFYENIWRKWDEDDDDDDYDYFVRCCEPRLKLHYDILEDRVPTDLIAEYHRLLSKCDETYKDFIKMRDNITTSDSETESEINNVSMVEGLKLYEELEKLKYKLQIMENPLYRYVLRRDGYGLPSKQAKGPRPSGEKVVHVVSKCMTIGLMQSLLKEKLNADHVTQEQVLEFHSDPVVAINACYEGDVVIICAGHYCVNGYFRIADSIQIEGYGLPDDVVLEKEGKGDTFVECMASIVKISNLKFVQHDATEGILCVRQGQTVLEGCVLQCDTTGVVLRTSAELCMKNCDLYGAKGAGLEIYPSSTCVLNGNDIHHCKEGILIKNFMEELYDVPKITMMNNLVHNHENYGVTMIKFAVHFGKKKAIPPIIIQPIDVEHMENPLNDEHSLDTNSGSHGTQDIPHLLVEHCSPNKYEQTVILNNSDIAECDEAVTNELISTSAKKMKLSRPRLGEAGDTEINDKLISQEIFSSIVGNHFRKNGKGSFGIVYY